MNNITPQDLKVLAEWVGKSSVFITDDVVYFAVAKRGFGVTTYSYRPLTNAEQSMELLKKLLESKSIRDTQQILEQISWATNFNKSLELAIIQTAFLQIKASQ